MDSFFDVKELAVYFGISQRTIYRMAEKGEIPSCKVGRQWRFPKDKIEEWLKWNSKQK
jgi:PTS system nitrogen regulatory IIA component